MRHKSLAAQGPVPRGRAAARPDLPRVQPRSRCAKAFPYATFAAIDDGVWQMKALDDASSAPLENAGERDDAVAARRHPQGRRRRQSCMTCAPSARGFLRSTRRSATRPPAPGQFPTPGHVTPEQFQRPYISAGHGAASPQHEAPHSFGVPEGQPSAEDYTRGLHHRGPRRRLPGQRHPPPRAPARVHGTRQARARLLPGHHAGQRDGRP